MKTTLQTLEIPLPDGNKEVLDMTEFATIAQLEELKSKELGPSAIYLYSHNFRTLGISHLLAELQAIRLDFHVYDPHDSRIVSGRLLWGSVFDTFPTWIKLILDSSGNIEWLKIEFEGVLHVINKISWGSGTLCLMDGLIQTCYDYRNDISAWSNFTYVYEMSPVLSKLVNIELPEGITTISPGVFAHFDNIYLPSTVTYCNTLFESYMTKYPSIYFPDNLVMYPYLLCEYQYDLSDATIDKIYIGTNAPQIHYPMFRNIKVNTLYWNAKDAVILYYKTSPSFDGQIENLIIGPDVEYIPLGLNGTNNMLLSTKLTYLPSEILTSMSYQNDFAIPRNILFISSISRSCTYFNDESNWENNCLYKDDCLLATRLDSGDGNHTLTIKEGIRAIAAGSLSTNYGWDSITIPTSVESISAFAVGQLDANNIQYQGTKAQWNSITREPGSLSAVSFDITIHCTDGDIIERGNY